MAENRYTFEWWCDAPGVSRWLRSIRRFDTPARADAAATGWLHDCVNNATPTKVRIVDLRKSATEETP